MPWTFLHQHLIFAATVVAPTPPPSPSPFLPPGDAARMAPSTSQRGRVRWGVGQGVTVRSPDGRFSLQFGAYIQVQALARYRAPIPATGTMTSEPTPEYHPATPAYRDFGLSLRRARLIFSGNLITPHIKYRIELTASPTELGYQDGTLHRTPLLDAFITLDRLRDASLRFGQFKVPYNHQRMIRASGLQFVDRAGANNEFTLDRDIGLDLHSDDIGGLGKLRYHAGVYLGDGIALPSPSDFGLAYVGRVELLPFGLYDDLEEADHDRSLAPRLLIGGAFAFIDRDPHDNHGFNGQVPDDGRRTSTENATADLNFRWAGLSIESAIFWRKAVQQTAPALDFSGNPLERVEARNGHGYFAQAGYLLPRLPLELGARFGQIRATGDPSATILSLRNQQELGGVFNYYFARHAFKLQFDYLRIWQFDIRQATDYFRLQVQAMF